MPVYEYACLSCKKEFEYQQRMADPAKTVCEACGGELERLISRTAFQLKGGGWYKDLYASTKPEAAAGASGGDTGTPPAKPDASPAPTPAATPAAPAKTESAAPAATKPAAASGSGTGSGTGTGGST